LIKVMVDAGDSTLVADVAAGLPRSHLAAASR
jgi:hypothetical protein